MGGGRKRIHPTRGHKVVTYQARYPFIRNDIFIIAEVNGTTGRQRVLLEHIDPKTNEILHEDSINCIHVNVCDIPVADLGNQNVQENLEEISVQIRSSKKLTEIRLTPLERFNALKSWTAGIAEAGIDAFRLQDQIDVTAKLQKPITIIFLKFLIKVDFNFIFQYLGNIEQIKRHTDTNIDSFLIASLIPVLEALISWEYDEGLKKSDEFFGIVDRIFALEPPLILFTERFDYLEFLEYPQAYDLAQKEQKKIELNENIISEENRARALFPIFETSSKIPEGDLRRKELEDFVLKNCPPVSVFNKVIDKELFNGSSLAEKLLIKSHTTHSEK